MSFDKCYYFRKAIRIQLCIIYFCQLQELRLRICGDLNFYKSHKWTKRSSLASFSKPPAPPACTVFRIRRERDLSTAVLNSEKKCYFLRKRLGNMSSQKNLEINEKNIKR